MHWYGPLFMWLLGLMMLATPFAVLYGCSWWLRNHEQPGWRIWVSKIGVVYSLLILAAMAVFLAVIPHSPPYAEFPYVYRWAPILARASAPCALFALFGRGRVRVALAVAAFGGVSFAMGMIAAL